MAVSSKKSATNVPQTARAHWTAPAVRRLAAGAAENAAGPVADDPVNFS